MLTFMYWILHMGGCFNQKAREHSQADADVRVRTMTILMTSNLCKQMHFCASLHHSEPSHACIISFNLQKKAKVVFIYICLTSREYT